MLSSLFRIKGMRRTALLLGLCSLLQAGSTILQAWSLARAVTILFQGEGSAAALPYLFSFLAAYCARHTCIWFARITSGRFAERASEALQRDLMQKLLERGAQHVAQNGTGKLVTLVIDGIVRFRTYLERFVPRVLDMAFITLPVLVFVYVLDALSGILLTVTLPILIGFFILLGSAARRTADRQWHSYQVLARHFTDTLRGLETLRFLGRSESFAATVARVSDRYRRATMRTLRVAFLSSFALDFFSTLSVAVVAVGLGLRLIEGGIDLMPALTVLLLAPEYYQPVRMLGTDFHASSDGKAAWRTIEQIMAMEHTREDKDMAVLNTSPSTVAIYTEQRAASATIQLDQVCVTGDEQDQALVQLSDLTFILDEQKRTVGIVGASGAGKTTLLNVLGGLLSPTSGTVKISDVPIDDRMRAIWQRQTAYIPQHPYLFSASLADNIRFYEPDATDEEVLRAAHAAGLSELLEELPRGIHEQIGEGGRGLSGGQVQRVALARALVGHRSILLLDEPTAHLDIETEWELKMTLLAAFEGRRVFLATHRIHWMPEMDWILVLEHGHLVEQGTHEQLMQSGGVYRTMLEAATGGASSG